MTDKQKVFIAEYLINGFNATQAAITAGYSEKTAYSIGNELLKKPEMRKAVQEHVNSTLDIKKDVLKNQIIDELSLIALDSEGFEIKYNKDGEPIGIMLNNKLKALELLGKYMVMFSDKVDHSGTITVKTEDMSKLTDAELAEIASKS